MSWAETFDPLLLRAQASIFPKIVMLDKDVKSKTINNKIVIAIVSSDEDKESSRILQSFIKEKYENGLGGIELLADRVAVNDIGDDFDATAYIVLQSEEEIYQKVVSRATQKNRIVFGYSYADFKYDSLISLLVKEKTYIYLNKVAMHRYDVKFLPVFYKIVKVIE